MKGRIDAAVRTIVYGSISAAAGVAAFLFFVIAAFLWTQQHYDTTVASGAAGGLFLLAALIALLTLAISRHRTAKVKREYSANAASAWLVDPAILVTAVQIVRAIGISRLMPIVLAGVAAFGATCLMANRSIANERKSRPKETKGAT